MNHISEQGTYTDADSSSRSAICHINMDNFEVKLLDELICHEKNTW